MVRSAKRSRDASQGMEGSRREVVSVKDGWGRRKPARRNRSAHKKQEADLFYANIVSGMGLQVCRQYNVGSGNFPT